MYFRLIAEVGAARATVITYVNPAVAVALGVIVLGEPLTVSIVGSFVLILAGSILATRANTRASTEAIPAGTRPPRRHPGYTGHPGQRASRPRTGTAAAAAPDPPPCAADRGQDGPPRLLALARQPRQQGGAGRGAEPGAGVQPGPAE